MMEQGRARRRRGTPTTENWRMQMLVFTRNDGQMVRIGDNIRITLMVSANGRTKLGIEAPREIPVHREEIFAAMEGDAESRESSHGRCLAAWRARDSDEVVNAAIEWREVFFSSHGKDAYRRMKAAAARLRRAVEAYQRALEQREAVFAGESDA